MTGFGGAESKMVSVKSKMEPGTWAGILWTCSRVQKYINTAATAITNGKKIYLHDAVLTPDLSYRLLHSASDASVGTMCSFGWMHNYYYYYFVSDVLPPVSTKHPCALAVGLL